MILGAFQSLAVFTEILNLILQYNLQELRVLEV